MGQVPTSQYIPAALKRQYTQPLKLEYIPSQRLTEAEHISFWTICLSHPSIGAFPGMRKDLVLIEIPLPQVTEHDDQSLHSEASHPGVTLLSSNMAEKKIKKKKFVIVNKYFYGSMILSYMDFFFANKVSMQTKYTSSPYRRNQMPSLDFLILIFMKTTILSL